MVIGSPEDGQRTVRRFTFPLLYSAKKRVVQVDYGSRSANSPEGLERGHVIPCHLFFTASSDLELQPLLEL